MRELLMIACASGSALTGLLLLALGQERHVERVCGPNRPAARAHRSQNATGFIAIGLSLPLYVAAQGAGFGSLLWMLMLAAAAMAVAFSLTWCPHLLRPLAVVVRLIFPPETPDVSNPANHLP